jgi:serine phosphatase RsbU (regulator of sigma subunit)
MKKQFLLSVLLLLFVTSSFGQNKTIDSLLILLKIDKADTNQLTHLYELSNEFSKIDNYDSGIKYANQAITLANVLLNTTNKATQQTTKIYTAKAYYNLGNMYYYKSDYLVALKNHFAALNINKTIGDKKTIAASYNNIANIYRAQANYPEALRNHSTSLKIRQLIGDEQGISSSYNNIGIVFEDQGNYVEALKNYFNALKIKEAMGDKEGVSIALNNIGNVYFSQNNYHDALKKYVASLKLREEIEDKNGIADSYGNIGNVYFNQSNYSEALKNYFIALKIKEKIGDSQGVASAYTNIGAAYLHQVNYQEALKNQLASLKIVTTIGDKLGACAAYNNIGSIYVQQKKYASAAEYYNKAKELAKEIGYKELLKESYNGLMKTDSAKGNFKGAFQNYKMYNVYSDSLNNEDVSKKILQSQMTYDFEKKEAVTEAEHKNELQSQHLISEEKNRKQNIIIISVIIGLFLVAVFAIMIFRSLRITSKQKNIIELKEKETQQQNEIITIQKHLVEEKHKEITDSINYAERIQRSFIATKDLLDENLKEYFVFFKPKDVVSGDFYWASRLVSSSGVENKNLFALAIADSTGHGVPGAIMSLLNVTSLEKAIEHHINPADILNHTRQTIIERLKKDGSEDGGKDGMDCSLLVFDFANKLLNIATANNPVWIIRGNEIIEIKPDKMPVGKSDKQDMPFTLHTIELQQGDTIYALTDGFPDQFGGPNGKKFMSKKLKELLLANAHLPIPQQKELLETTFKNWIGDLEQVDDVCMVGIRV